MDEEIMTFQPEIPKPKNLGSSAEPLDEKQRH